MSQWQQLFGQQLVANDGTQQKSVPTSALEGKHVGIYFSAHWCPPCRGFTPRLVETYKTLLSKDKGIEVVFVSMDRNQAAFNEYFGTMPWLAVPYADDQLRSVLSRKFNVQGIPTLVMLGPDGNILNSNARAAVDGDPQAAAFPWDGVPPTQAARMPPVHLLLLAFLIWFVVNTYLFPPKPKA